MITNLLEVIKEQASFGFTGKVNILISSSGQFHGVVYLIDGHVVGAETGVLKGKKALYKLIFDDVDSVIKFRFVVEPEVVSDLLCSMKMNFDQIKTEAQKFYQKYILAKKLKPAPELKLVINPEVIVNHELITADEFDVLSILTEWSKVADVYKYSKLMEFEVTSALVNLRKKRAIKVFQN